MAVRALVLTGIALLASACTTGLGPRAVRVERPDFNQQIARSADAEMLLNVVRLRYNDSPQFLELGAVVAQYGYDATVSVGGQISEGGASSGTAGVGLGYSEKPTVTYTPLAGDEFAERMLAPIPLDSLMLFSQSGWSTERLLLVAVQRVNDMFNAPTVSGPTPERAPDYRPFAELAERMHRLQAADVLGLNWERQASDADPPGRNARFWVKRPADVGSALAADTAAVRRALALPQDTADFQLTAYPFRRQPHEVGVRCRSLLGVLYFLSAAVAVPPPHVRAGLVTTTVDDQGRPFDWTQVTGKVMAIHSQEDRPRKAYVAVRHRGWWFYIADDDQSSKATFSLVNILFSLQSATGKGKSPLLTLPVGR